MYDARDVRVVHIIRELYSRTLLCDHNVMAKNEIPELRQLRDDYDKARERLLASIHRYLAAGRGPSEIGRSVDWTREYIAKIRDGKVND
jgi:hypothetical protein